MTFEEIKEVISPSIVCKIGNAVIVFLPTNDPALSNNCECAKKISPGIASLPTGLSVNKAISRIMLACFVKSSKIITTSSFSEMFSA
ncbi:Uncharacterised protein [Chlamydia trachomatis]|nr:Uncharacterised protein [Chlamydia trachomatis]